MAIFTNQASLSYGGNTVNSNIVTGNIVEVLSVTKTAVNTGYSANEEITYIISVTNSGPAAITSVTVTDNLAEYAFGSGNLVPLDYVTDSLVYYQNGVLQPTPAITATAPLTISGLTVPSGGNVMLIYEAKTNSYAPLSSQSTLTNEAVVNATGLTSPVTATETITVTDEPVLAITKGLSPTDVTENSELTYTFTIQNTGNTAADATDNVIISDTFNPVLTDITVTLNGVVVPEAAYTYDQTTGAFATVAGSITVPEATYVQNPDTGIVTITPGVTVITVSGTV